uniref:Integrase catalytic domain-containing protein n=1 Tax=Lactuca sativa TaxID=4236 RepID=A0A9R1XKQ2_LACSA|nr:hypothetical protein LSAT_V11C400180650 [Lactuca sativa]
MDMFTWLVLLRKKSHIVDEIITLIKQCEVLYDRKVRQLRSDHGTEFRSSSLEEFCSNTGIYQNFFVVRTPQQNCITERRNRTFYEAGRTMVVETSLPLSFWVEAVNTLPKWRKPDISYFHVFGCVCYILNQRDQRSKFEIEANDGVFLGYFSISKAFKLFNLSRQTVKETSHFLPSEVERIVPNVDLLIISQPISKDEAAILEEAEPSNPRIIQDHPESQIIGHVTYGILTFSRVSGNFYMLLNSVSMIEPNNVTYAFKRAD